MCEKLTQNVGVQQEEGDSTDCNVAQASQLAQLGALGVPAEDQGDQQNVDDDAVDAQGPDQTVSECTNGEQDHQDQSTEEEVCHDLLVAALQEEQTDQDPEQAKEAEHGTQVLAVVASAAEQEHADGGVQLADAAEDDGDVAQSTGELFMVSALDADTDLFQAEADNGSKQAKNANCLRIYREHNVLLRK